MTEELNFTIRTATPADASIITRHRRAMFEDMRLGTSDTLDTMDVKFAPWVERKIACGEYIGWFVIDEQQTVIAGAGLWIMEWPAGPLDQSDQRGYVMNIYVEPDHRRQGLARQLLHTALDYCRENGLCVVALHASNFGRSLYESLGFKQTNEMRIQLEENK